MEQYAMSLVAHLFRNEEDLFHIRERWGFQKLFRRTTSLIQRSFFSYLRFSVFLFAFSLSSLLIFQIKTEITTHDHYFQIRTVAVIEMSRTKSYDEIKISMNLPTERVPAAKEIEIKMIKDDGEKRDETCHFCGMRCIAINVGHIFCTSCPSRFCRQCFKQVDGQTFIDFSIKEEGWSCGICQGDCFCRTCVQDLPPCWASMSLEFKDPLQKNTAFEKCAIRFHDARRRYGMRPAWLKFEGTLSFRHDH